MLEGFLKGWEMTTDETLVSLREMVKKREKKGNERKKSLYNRDAQIRATGLNIYIFGFNCRKYK